MTMGLTECAVLHTGTDGGQWDQQTGSDLHLGLLAGPEVQISVANVTTVPWLSTTLIAVTSIALTIPKAWLLLWKTIILTQ